MSEIIDSAVLASCAAIDAAMAIIQPYQLGQKEIGPAKLKADETLVTHVDREAASAARAVLRERLGDTVGFSIEDIDGQAGGLGSRFELKCDFLDGTNAFTCGLSTSTVGIGVYDREAHELVAATIGEPATGRIWTAGKGKGAFLTAQAEGGHRLSVWQGERANPNIFLDVSHGFTRGDRTILDGDQVAELFSRLNQCFKVLMPGSNLLQQALVAMGKEGVAGAVMTAKGGDWDATGVLLVLEAGGAAKAFTVLPRRGIKEENPLDVTAYDLLVVGNTPSTVQVISGMISQLF